MCYKCKVLAGKHSHYQIVRCRFPHRIQLNLINKHEQNRWKCVQQSTSGIQFIDLNTSLPFRMLKVCSKSGFFFLLFLDAVLFPPSQLKPEILLLLIFFFSDTFLAFVSLLDWNQQKQQLFLITLFFFFVTHNKNTNVIDNKICSGEKKKTNNC